MDNIVVAPIVLIACVVLNRLLHALCQEGCDIHQAIDVVRVAKPKLQLPNSSAGHELYSLNHVRPGVDVRQKPFSASVIQENAIRV